MSLENKNDAGTSAPAGAANPAEIKAIIGLGNPGGAYANHRHTIGFRIIDALAERCGASWREREHMLLAQIQVGACAILLIKPQTFMNNSGKVVPYLVKQGIKPETMLIIHDELELPFGQVKFKFAGSHKGHNGLKSIIAGCGSDFWRLRFGIGRPEDRAQVANYVLQNFAEPKEEIEKLVAQAVSMIEQMLARICL
jgi:PTH1 family peptidyl-tRNA hydrolase